MEVVVRPTNLGLLYGNRRTRSWKSNPRARCGRRWKQRRRWSARSRERGRNPPKKVPKKGKKEAKKELAIDVRSTAPCGSTSPGIGTAARPRPLGERGSGQSPLRHRAIGTPSTKKREPGGKTSRPAEREQEDLDAKKKRRSTFFAFGKVEVVGWGCSSGFDQRDGGVVRGGI